MSRPRIGVSGPDLGGLVAWAFTWLAIRRAGGRAVRITPRRPRPVSELDGLVIGGGVDVAESLPADDQPLDASRPWYRRLWFRLSVPFRMVLRWLFRLRSSESSGDVARDRLEATLLRAARREDVPTLGICRGCQLMARIEGGALSLDVGQRHPDREALWTPFPARAVTVEPRSALFEALGGAEHCVNALHRHAVGSVPAPMRIVARETKAPIAQGIEHPARTFWIGVQWHPEYLPQSAAQRRLFAKLVEAAVAHRDRAKRERRAREPTARAIAR